jgi:hypothetical protein
VRTIVETASYLADADYAGMSDEDRTHVATFLAIHPDAGDVIKGSNGARKVRIARKGGGKSGGYRVITTYVAGTTVYLLAAYAKSDRATLKTAEVNELAKLISEIEKAHKPGRDVKR